MNKEETTKKNIAPQEAIETKKEVVKKVEPKEEVKESVNITDTGINLIPTLSKEEAVVEESKKKLNIGSVLSLLALVLVSIGIVGFNIMTKIRLNTAKEELYAHENSIMGISQKIVNNNEILERVGLYEDIQEGAYSPKEVIDYINNIAEKSGGNTIIGDFTFGDDLSFTFSGTGNNLEEVSKFWYLLTHDPKVETVNLDSVGKSNDKIRFNFEGKLVFNYFANINE
jgi:hypothetical protein